MIHHTDPFATPERDRSPVRRFRGRLVAPVTLWTAPGGSVLTVSSMVVADGEPGRVAGLVDEESDLFAALTAAGRFAVCPLSADERSLADQFAGLAPLAGHPTWVDTAYGPVLAGDRSWLGCRLDTAAPFGWSRLVEGAIAQVTIGGDGDAAALAHYRGRYHPLPAATGSD